MIAYSFTVDESQFSDLTNALLSGREAYWLRESLPAKEISKVNQAELSEFDRNGRIFTGTWELKYQKLTSTHFQCVVVSDEVLDETLKEWSFHSQQIQAENKEPRAYFVESLKAIVKTDSVFSSKYAQILMKEYYFSDEEGGSCFRLCGVR